MFMAFSVDQNPSSTLDELESGGRRWTCSCTNVSLAFGFCFVCVCVNMFEFFSLILFISFSIIQLVVLNYLHKHKTQKCMPSFPELVLYTLSQAFIFILFFIFILIEMLILLRRDSCGSALLQNRLMNNQWWKIPIHSNSEIKIAGIDLDK